MIPALACGPFLNAVRCQSSSDPAATLIAEYRQHPTDPVLCERIGVTYTRAQDFELAAEWYRKALKLDPQRLSARKNLAVVLWFGGHHEQAERDFEELVKRAPADPVPHLYLGLAAYGRSDYARASKHFEQAGELASDNPEAQQAVAESYLASGRAQEAGRILEKVIAAGNATAQDYRMLAEAYDRQKRPEEAYAAYRKAIEADTGDESLIALARFAVAHGNTTYAREVLSGGMERHPNSARLHFEAGTVWSLDGNFGQAQAEYAKAAGLDAHWSLPVLAQGVGQLQQGKNEQAAATFRRAIELAPGDYRGHYLLATAQERVGAREDAARRTELIATLRRAIQLNPDYARAHAALAEAYLSAGLQQAGGRELETASKLAPDDTNILYRFSAFLRQSGRTQEADRTLAAFRKAKAHATEQQDEFVQILKTSK